MAGAVITAITGLRKPEGTAMNAVKIYPSRSGGWIYEVWVAARLVVIGWSRTREAAEQEALLV